MTTFVPLAQDIDGTVSAVAVGDWLLQIIRERRPELTDSYYAEFLSQFYRDAETQEQSIASPLSLFSLLLSQHELIFEYLNDAHTNSSTSSSSGTSTVSAEGGGSADGAAKEGNRRPASEVMREVEEFFSVLMSLICLRMINNHQDAGTAAGRLCTVFTIDKTNLPEFRLKLLQALYNIFPPNFPYRFPIFLATLEYAATTGLFHVMLPYVQFIDDWLVDWRLAANSKRGVFLIFATQLKKLGKTEEAYPFLRRHVEGFQKESLDVLSAQATIRAAADLAVDSIKEPNVLLFDGILGLDAVKQLKNSTADNQALFELLEIFMSGGPTEFEKFYVTHEALFHTHCLDKESCLNKIRLLALASRCVDECELSPKDIAKHLDIAAEDVEAIVVKAIGQGLLDAKIDQINKTIHIKSAMQREFGLKQWEQLADRLAIWTDNVKILQKAVQDGKLRMPVEV